MRMDSQEKVSATADRLGPGLEPVETLKKVLVEHRDWAQAEARER